MYVGVGILYAKRIGMRNASYIYVLFSHHCLIRYMLLNL